jgi:hypothetical protein
MLELAERVIGVVGVSSKLEFLPGCVPRGHMLLLDCVSHTRGTQHAKD